MARRVRPKDPDVRALVAACKALEGSTSTRTLHANLRFLWDRYVVNPPAKAWWLHLNATNPDRRTP
jgi:hypothetical protein